jgi:hypothetical protein
MAMRRAWGWGSYDRPSPGAVLRVCFEAYERSNKVLEATLDTGADSFTLAISHLEGRVAVLDAIRERRPPLRPEAVVEEFAALLRRWCPKPRPSSGSDRASGRLMKK